MFALNHKIYSTTSPYMVRWLLNFINSKTAINKWRFVHIKYAVKRCLTAYHCIVESQVTMSRERWVFPVGLRQRLLTSKKESSQLADCLHETQLSTLHSQEYTHPHLYWYFDPPPCPLKTVPSPADSGPPLITYFSRPT